MASTGDGRRRYLVISSCPELWGGSEELWWEASMRLLDQDHDVEVLRYVTGAHPRLAALERSGGDVRDLTKLAARRWLRLLSVVWPGRRGLSARRRLVVAAAVVLLRRRPDLVVISQGQSTDGLMFTHACRKLRVPYVLVAQKASELYWPPDEARFRHREAYLSARASVFVAEHNRRVTEDQIGVELPASVVLRNPVLHGAMGPRSWPETRDGTLRLACVARLFPPEKGQDVLIRALAHPRWRDRALRVDLFGTGPNAEGLQELVERLGLTGQIRFRGHSDDIGEVWREHHALVLPSHAEGLPLAIVEAMMCGRPVLVTDVGGNPEIVEDGVTGFVSAVGVRAFDQGLERLWDARDELPEMGRAAGRAIRAAVPPDPVGPFVDLLLECSEGR